MMASRALLVLGLLFAATLFVSSAGAGRELAEETKGMKSNQASRVENQELYGSNNHNWGGSNGGYHGGGGGSRCSYGCCHHGYYGGCQCCSHPDEMPDAEYLGEPHN